MRKTIVESIFDVHGLLRPWLHWLELRSLVELLKHNTRKEAMLYNINIDSLSTLH